MRRLRWLSVVVLVGCGGDDGAGNPDAAVDAATDAGADAAPPFCAPLMGPSGAGGGGNAGFVTPTAVAEAYTGGDGVWTLVGPANFSCLGDNGRDPATTPPVAASGTALDFQTGNLLDAADVAAFECLDFTTQADTATSDANGDFSVSVAAPITRWNLLVSAVGQLDTYHANLPVEGASTLMATSVSELTANALPAFIGVTRTVGRGLVIGTIVDCDGNRVAGAAATLSATPLVVDHLLGAESYYFSALSTSLPVRASQQSASNTDGLFLAIELVPAATAYVQVWGFVDGQNPATDPLTLLSQVGLPIVADSFVNVTLDPLR